MVKRKDFVSDGLVTLRHKYVAENLNARKSDADVSAFYIAPDVDKRLSIQEQQTQIYHQMHNDLEISLHQQLAVLETQIDIEKQNLAKREDIYKKFGKMLETFTDLPKSIEAAENSEAQVRLEQLRVEFFSKKAACLSTTEKNSINNASAINSPQISLLPELNSLNQLQMLKMGFCFALPLFAVIILGCIIIAWVIIITWGG